MFPLGDLYVRCWTLGPLSHPPASWLQGLKFPHDPTEGGGERRDGKVSGGSGWGDEDEVEDEGS